MLRILATLMLCFLVAACGRQPEESLMRDTVESALETAFGDQTFKVVEFVRRGSAVDSTAPAGETRRVVYYDVELELTRDLMMGDWDDPGAATLVTLLGAGPRSIEGVKAGGNATGDRIVAHASAIYRDDGDVWSFVMPAAFREAPPPTAESGAAVPVSRQALNTLSEITRSVEAGGSRAAQNAVDQELQRSVARISGRLTRIEQGYPVAAGQNRGEYAAFVSALAELAQARGLRIVPLITGGGEDNLELLRSGSVVVGLAQADTARSAYEGTGPFAAAGAFASLRALGSLYPEYVHIVVRSDTGLASAADLKGTRIALGPEGSALRDTLTRVLDAHGLVPGQDYEAVSMRFGEALPALRRGEVDAAVHVIGLPATPLREALGGEAGALKLLPLASDAVERLTAAGRGLMPATIAAGVYPEQRVSVATVAVPALLLTTEDTLSPEEASRLAHFVYESGNDLLAHGSAQGSQVSARSARRGLTVPLHPGAEQALAELTAAPAKVAN